MPFPTQKPKPFDRSSVESLSPGVMGCYGLFREDRWVYIGKGAIRERLLAHLGGDVPWMLQDSPTHWVAIETSDYDAVQKELVLACNPVCGGGPGSIGAAGQSAREQQRVSRPRPRRRTTGRRPSEGPGHGP